ncbi:MAG: DUF899 family protein [Proteobacteria bacterium]|nr:DUF899 family protein [Pseudomonadota bacterium]
MDRPRLTPAAELVRANTRHFPNETAGYRRARNELLAEEIELRRHIARVAEMRRALPPGGEVTKPYMFEGEQGTVSLDGLFADKETLVVYSFMFGPQRARICPMCTSFMNAWDDKIPALRERIAIAFVARSPIARIAALKKQRGWTRMPLYSDASGDYTRDYVSEDDADVPGYAVFTRRADNGKPAIRHFWSGEMSGAMADPGQDPRGAPDLDPLWAVLDTTPEGRGDWYPKLHD